MSKQTPSLRDLQLWMKWAVTDPRGVIAALANPYPKDLANLERYTSPQIDALPWIKEEPPISKSERLDIYAEAYFSRIYESMKDDFRATARLLGEISFQKLVADYLKEYPSNTSNIGEVGRSFSRFVSSYQDLLNAPFLAPLVELEWLAIESFYANNSGHLDPSRLAALTEEDWAEVSFKLAPSVHLLKTNWPLDQMWNLRDGETEVDFPSLEFLNESQQFILLRDGEAVSFEKTTASEYLILQRLQSEVSLTAALEEVGNLNPNQDIETHVMTWFNDWVSRGVICDFHLSYKKVDL